MSRKVAFFLSFLKGLVFSWCGVEKLWPNYCEVALQILWRKVSLLIANP